MNRRLYRDKDMPTDPMARFSSARVQTAILIATAGRSELERLCERAGIAHTGQSTPALRRALRYRMSPG